jgi:hypothetical protein
MTATNKRYSYLRVMVIQIDVRAGENPTNMSHAFNAWSAYGPVVINRVEQIHHPWEKGLPSQSIARRLIDPWVCTQFLSHNSHWSSGEKPSFCWQLATRFTGPIYQHAIDTFNTCSRGLTNRSLTDTGGCYNLGGAGFQHHTLRPSQPVVFAFHLRVPPGLQLRAPLEQRIFMGNIGFSFL